MRMKKGQRNHVLCPFSVGANCVRPRAFTERPYEDDFLSAGKTCFMEGAPYGVFSLMENIPVRAVFYCLSTVITVKKLGSASEIYF